MKGRSNQAFLGTEKDYSFVVVENERETSRNNPAPVEDDPWAIADNIQDDSEKWEGN